MFCIRRNAVPMQGDAIRRIFAEGRKGRQHLQRCCRDSFLPAVSGQERSARPEVGRGVPTPPSLPLVSTHPATGPGLLALDKPKAVGSTRKN